MPKQRNMQRRQDGLIVPSSAIQNDIQQAYQQGYQQARQQAQAINKQLAAFDAQYRRAVDNAVIEFAVTVSRCLDVHLLAPAVIGHELTRRRARLNAAWDETHRQLLRYDKGLDELARTTGAGAINSPAAAIQNRLSDIGCQVKDALTAFELDGDTSKLVALDEYWQDGGLDESLQLAAVSDIIDSRRADAAGGLYIGHRLDELATAPGRRLKGWPAIKAVYQELARIPADKRTEHQRQALDIFHQDGWPDNVDDIKSARNRMDKYRRRWLGTKNSQ